MKFTELIKKYKVYILSVLLVIFFFRSCSKSTQSRKSNDKLIETEQIIDSLNRVITDKKVVIHGFTKVLKNEKIKIHSEYDNYISERDRGVQLMELHMVVKENLKELRDEK